MKIAVAGSHGTGKTSFAKGLAKKLKCKYIGDIVRDEAAPKHFEINEKTPPEVQVWLVARQWDLEKTTPEDWVADKCLFDYLVYGEIVLENQASEKAAKVKEAIREIVKDNTNYDLVFYLPIEFPMELDGLRSPNDDFQKEVDRRYKKLLEEWGIKYIILPSFSKESASRAEAMLETIRASVPAYCDGPESADMYSHTATSR